MGLDDTNVGEAFRGSWCAIGTLVRSCAGRPFAPRWVGRGRRHDEWLEGCCVVAPVAAIRLDATGWTSSERLSAAPAADDATSSELRQKVTDLPAYATTLGELVERRPMCIGDQLLVAEGQDVHALRSSGTSVG
jgi:hypothetical protein